MKRISTLLFALSLLCPMCLNGKSPTSDKEVNPKIEESNRFPFCKNDKCGYMDKNCKVVINPRFDEAWDFSEGLAWVEIGGKGGYINKEGKMVWREK